MLCSAWSKLSRVNNNEVNTGKSKVKIHNVQEGRKDSKREMKVDRQEETKKESKGELKKENWQFYGRRTLNDQNYIWLENCSIGAQNYYMPP